MLQVLTRLKYPEGLALQSRVAQYTSDIHSQSAVSAMPIVVVAHALIGRSALPAFLRMSDHPRYLKYLIDTRGIQTVLFSNTQYVYEILPAMVEQTPGVAWIDVRPPSELFSSPTLPALLLVCRADQPSPNIISICTMKRSMDGRRMAFPRSRSSANDTSLAL